MILSEKIAHVGSLNASHECLIMVRVDRGVLHIRHLGVPSSQLRKSKPQRLLSHPLSASSTSFQSHPTLRHTPSCSYSTLHLPLLFAPLTISSLAPPSLPSSCLPPSPSPSPVGINAPAPQDGVASPWCPLSRRSISRASHPDQETWRSRFPDRWSPLLLPFLGMPPRSERLERLDRPSPKSQWG